MIKTIIINYIYRNDNKITTTTIIPIGVILCYYIVFLVDVDYIYSLNSFCGQYTTKD